MSDKPMTHAEAELSLIRTTDRITRIASDCRALMQDVGMSDASLRALGIIGVGLQGLLDCTIERHASPESRAKYESICRDVRESKALEGLQQGPTDFSRLVH